MVFTWFLGDLYKTVYFVVRSAPFQFILCGFTQITFDVLIFIQVLIYKKASYAKLAKAYVSIFRFDPFPPKYIIGLYLPESKH